MSANIQWNTLKTTLLVTYPLTNTCISNNSAKGPCGLSAT